MRKLTTLVAVSTTIFSLTGFNAAAQVHSKGAADTTTYVLYNGGQNFDSKRTIVFEDKHSVDSLANLLATQDNKLYRIIFQKEHQQARVISSKYLKTLNKSGFYRITIAYNKQDEMDEQKPMYIITSK